MTLTFPYRCRAIWNRIRQSGADPGLAVSHVLPNKPSKTRISGAGFLKPKPRVLGVESFQPLKVVLPRLSVKVTSPSSRFPRYALHPIPCIVHPAPEILIPTNTLLSPPQSLVPHDPMACFRTNDPTSQSTCGTFPCVGPFPDIYSNFHVFWPPNIKSRYARAQFHPISE